MDEVQEKLLSCTLGYNCFNCRSNGEFRKNIETQLGHEIVCPREIPIGASLSQLPDKAKGQVIKRTIHQEKIPLQTKKINTLLVSLEEKIPSELLEDLLILKSTLLPDTKSPQTCIFGGDKVSTFDLHCCGGKVTPTEIFACEIKDVTIKRQCHHCDSYHPTMEKEDQTNEES